MSYIIRPARPEDAEAACRVRIDAWRETYPGQVPQKTLDEMNLERDVARFHERMNDPANKTKNFVVEVDGKIVGVGACGPARMDDTKGRGEIYMIYFLDEAKGKGLGKKLMQAMAEELFRQGMTSVRLNVLDTNAKAIRFYESLGGVYAGEGAFKMGDTELKDSFYVWDDIRTLLPPRLPKPPLLKP